jgi:hypothetical protein
MKQKDVALIIVIIGGAAIVSFVIFGFIFGKQTSAKVNVEVVEPISASFELPNTKFFNSASLNPTQTITISPDSNQNPFN